MALGPKRLDGGAHPNSGGFSPVRAARAQSGLIGYVLIIGMVIASATLIAFTGASVMDQYRELIGQESTTNAIEEIDTELSSVASVGGLTRTGFSLGDAKPSQYRIVNDGYINITLNGNPHCRAHIPLSSIRYEREDGVIFGYEAGAVWRQENGVVDQTVMHTPPDVTFEDGTLTLSVINVSGRIDGPENLVYEDVNRTKSTNENISDTLFNTTAGCARPDTINISVTSDFYRGWEGYFRSSLNASKVEPAPDQTVWANFSEEKLPEIVDDDRNDVVDLTSGGIIDNTDTSITVDKPAVDNSKTYTTIVTPLSSGSTQVGEIKEIEGGTAYRPPLDVVFVVDESGSMDGQNEEDAREAARAFVGQMNESVDRAGVVGFNDDGRILTTSDGGYLTSDFGSASSDPDGVNGSIEDIEAPPSAGTDMTAGIHTGNVLFGLKSNSSRNKVMVFLGDGENSPGVDDEDTIDEAELAADAGITIHAVGVDGADEDVLRQIAETTGGTYRYVDDTEDLSGVFKELFAEISESKQIVRDPFSMKLEAGGTAFYPQFNGDTTHIANGTEGPNLNDPTAPSEFSYSIDVSDGEPVKMTATDYDCLEWGPTGESYVNNSTKQVYAVARCTEMANPTPVDPTDTSVYVSGDDVSTLLDQPSNWWNEDLKNETLAPYLVGPNNETLQLESNQALVVFEFQDSDGASDRIIVLYRIGQSEEDAVAEHILNAEVRHLVIGEDD